MAIKLVGCHIARKPHLRLQITRIRLAQAASEIQIRLRYDGSPSAMVTMGDGHHHLIGNGIDSRLNVIDDKTNVEQSREGAISRMASRPVREGLP